MRVIHTSDWHLGQHFYTKSRAPEHEAFLTWLLQQVEKHQVDAIIVAGDIFDTGSPPSYARELYNRFVVALQPTGCQLIILAGNHDSVATLNESRELLACLNTLVTTTPDNLGDTPLTILKQRNGQPGALLCAVPFLRPRDLLQSQAGQSAADKQLSLQEAISQHYHQLHQHALALRKQLGMALPIIATGHLTALGVTSSSSVRDIYIGTLDAFPASLFPDFDYLALGHIHRAQIVAGQPHIRYSGSPLPLSFDEVGQSKSVTLVEFHDGILQQITTLDIPLFQPMQLIKGDMQQIIEQIKALKTQTQTLWLDIEINSQEYLRDLQLQIQQITATLPVEVLLLRRSKSHYQRQLQQQDKETLDELSVNEVFERRLAQSTVLEDAQQSRLRQLFAHIVAQVSEADNPADTDAQS